MTQIKRPYKTLISLISLFFLFLSACSGEKVTYDYPTSEKDKSGRPIMKKERRENSLTLFSFSNFLKEKEKEKEKNILKTKNKYLWKAAIEAISFAKIKTINEKNGVLITQWFTKNKDQNQRFKIKILVKKNNQLKAKNITLMIEKQKVINGKWVEQNVDSTERLNMIDLILNHARDLKYLDEQS